MYEYKNKDKVLAVREVNARGRNAEIGRKLRVQK